MCHYIHMEPPLATCNCVLLVTLGNECASNLDWEADDPKLLFLALPPTKIHMVVASYLFGFLIEKTSQF